MFAVITEVVAAQGNLSIRCALFVFIITPIRSYLSGWVTAFCYFNEKGKCQGTEFSLTKWDGRVFKSDYPLINTNDIPSGLVSVPITVDDNGHIVKTRMLAGSFTMNVLDDTTIAPRLDWCLGVIDETKFKADPYTGMW